MHLEAVHLSALHASQRQSAAGMLLRVINIVINSAAELLCAISADQKTHMWLKAIMRRIFQFSNINTSKFGVSSSRMCDAGLGNGARVAAVVGTKCRGTIAGFALLSYPLEVRHSILLCSNFPAQDLLHIVLSAAITLRAHLLSACSASGTKVCKLPGSKLQQSQSSHANSAH